MSENPVICFQNREDGPAGSSEGDRPENSRDLAGAPGGEEPGLSFLELVYGVLFEPGKTMEKVVQKPPLGIVALVVAVLSMLGSLMGMLIISKSLGAAAGRPLPGIGTLALLGIVLGLFWGYLKWFGYSAVVHLTAELLGGGGGAKGVFAAVGLAGLPYIFNIPVQFMGYWFGAGNVVLFFLAGLAFGVWSVVLLVVGVCRAHGLSCSRAALAVFTPALALVFLLFLVITTMVFIVSYVPSSALVPGYF